MTRLHRRKPVARLMSIGQFEVTYAETADNGAKGNMSVSRFSALHTHARQNRGMVARGSR
jgi:hypothetical protein